MTINGNQVRTAIVYEEKKSAIGYNLRYIAFFQLAININILWYLNISIINCIIHTHKCTGTANDHLIEHWLYISISSIA